MAETSSMPTLFTKKQDEYLIYLKETRQLSWTNIEREFSNRHSFRTRGALQVRYSRRLRYRDMSRLPAPTSDPSESSETSDSNDQLSNEESRSASSDDLTLEKRAPGSNNQQSEESEATDSTSTSKAPSSDAFLSQSSVTTKVLTRSRAKQNSTHTSELSGPAVHEQLGNQPLNPRKRRGNASSENQSLNPRKRHCNAQIEGQDVEEHLVVMCQETRKIRGKQSKRGRRENNARFVKVPKGPIFSDVYMSPGTNWVDFNRGSSVWNMMLQRPNLPYAFANPPPNRVVQYNPISDSFRIRSLRPGEKNLQVDVSKQNSEGGSTVTCSLATDQVKSQRIVDPSAPTSSNTVTENTHPLEVSNATELVNLQHTEMDNSKSDASSS